MTRAGDGSEDLGSLTVHLHAFTSYELRATVRKLNDYRGIRLGGGFKNGIDGVGADDVHGWQSELVRLGKSENLLHIRASGNTGFDYVEEFV